MYFYEAGMFSYQKKKKKYSATYLLLVYLLLNLKTKTCARDVTIIVIGSGLKNSIAQSTGVVENTDCTSTEG